MASQTAQTVVLVDGTSPIRTEPSTDPTTIYFVRLNHRGGYFAEVDDFRGVPYTEARLVKDLEESTYDNPIIAIFAASVTAGTFLPVSREIASLVFYRADGGGKGFEHLNGTVRDFLDAHGFDITGAQEEWDAVNEAECESNARHIREELRSVRAI